jgi:hypothetical protein
MRLNNLLVLNAVVALGFGIAFLLLPATVVELYGLASASAANVMGQLFGVELIAVGLVTWFVRGVQDVPALRAIILALMLADVVGLIVVLAATLSGAMNAVG